MVSQTDDNQQNPSQNQSMNTCDRLGLYDITIDYDSLTTADCQAKFHELQQMNAQLVQHMVNLDQMRVKIITELTKLQGKYNHINSA